MTTTDTLFKVKRNIIPTLRGFIKYLLSPIYVNTKFEKGIRIGKGTEWIVHPGCRCRVKSGVVCGKHATIAISSKGNLEIGKGVGIGNGNQIVCHHHISIGDGTLLGPYVMIYDHDHQYSYDNGVNKYQYEVSEVTIGNNCWLGAGSIILKGVHIGNNCIIAAGSVVTKDLPDGCVVAGSPARIIKSKDAN